MAPPPPLPEPPPPEPAGALDAGRPYRVALLGANVGHSRLPAAFAAAWRRLGADGLCVRVDLSELNLPVPRATSEALRGAACLGFDGVAVTMPCKETALDTVDELDAAARVIGAVNAVRVRRPPGAPPRLVGYNLDWLGAYRAFRERLPAGLGPAGRACVVGAGGSSRAIVYALARLGARAVSLFDSDRPRAAAAAAALSAALAAAGCACAVRAEGELRTALGGCDGVANCTPVGMHGGPPGSPVPKDTLQTAGLRWVFDVVCYPAETELLRDAAALGLTTVPGIRMNDHILVEMFALLCGAAPDALPGDLFAPAPRA